jgi:uncharacterized peroxidase-related enzyme
VALLFRNWREAELDAQDTAMLEYAEKLTYTPSQVEEADVQRLRDAGFDDVQILDIAIATAYRNFINRIALGLGVEPTITQLSETDPVILAALFPNPAPPS